MASVASYILSLPMKPSTNGKSTNGKVFINPVVLTLLRERAGLSVRGLADRAEVAPSTISRIERSFYRTRRGTLRSIAKALKTREEVLIWR